MSSVILIALARALHVLAGVAWAGAIFSIVGVLVPLAMRHREQGAGRWMGMAVMRAGQASGIAAMLTVLTGIYLFAVLHAHDDTASGLVLKTGALAALASMVLGIVLSRPVARKLAELEAQLAGAAPTPEQASQLAALRAKQLTSGRLVAALLAVAVLAMGLFRYATVLV